jgi:membrane fusion protein, multidrug efflux system
MRIIIASISIIVVFHFSHCGRPTGDEVATTEEIGVAVSVQEVTQREMPILLNVRGNVRAWEQAMIAGASGVRISSIMVRPGDRVQRGQVLARMSDEQLEQARVRLEMAETERERLDTLLKIGAVSKQQFDQAQSEFRNAQANFRMMRENIELTAPFTGTITERHFNPGEIFTPSAQAPAILTLMQLNPIQIMINVGEAYFGRIRENMTAEVRIDNYPDTVFQGQIYRVYPSIMEASRTFQTEIRVENAEQLLRPGMYARVSIQLEEISGIFIPISAVQRQPGTSDQYVFVVEDSTAYQIPIETGNRIEQWIQATTGLSEGQMIVTEGMARLDDGDLVRVMRRE